MERENKYVTWEWWGQWNRTDPRPVIAFQALFIYLRSPNHHCALVRARFGKCLSFPKFFKLFHFMCIYKCVYRQFLFFWHSSGFSTCVFLLYILPPVHQNYVGVDAEKNPFYLSVVLSDQNNQRVPQYRAILWRKTVRECVQYDPWIISAICSWPSGLATQKRVKEN